MNSNRLLLRLLQRSWTWIIVSIVLGFSGAIFNGVGVTLIVPLILVFLGVDLADSGKLPPLFDSIFSALEAVPENYRIAVMLACIVSAILLKNLMNYANSISSGLLTRKFTSSLRKEGFQLLLDVDIHYLTQKRLGELINYINTETGRVASAVKTLISITISSITILVFLVILVTLSWQLTLISFAIIGLIALINQFFIKFAKSMGRELSSASTEYSSRAIELLSGMRLVKSAANEDQEYREIGCLIDKREKSDFRSQLAYAAISPVNETLSIFAVILLVFIGRGLYTDSLETYASVLITYLFVLTRVLPVIGQLNGARSQLANVAASVDIVEDFLDRTNKPIMTFGNTRFSGLRDKIEFKNLWFRYPGSDSWSLSNINLTIPKGQTLALVGASGAGKSTLADLLARFYDPNEGCIEVDGIDIQNLNLHQFRKKIGIVSQETFLFNASVRENIKYGCLTATDEDVFEAAKKANALDFIQDLPQGFDTKIGDRGTRLSGGQRQRIAIARALLQNPEILILDEATSALDTISERLVQQALEELSQERTALVIAHRLSTVQKANQIAVLDKGNVVELGTHQELLARGGYYSKLHSIQFAVRDDSGKSNPLFSESEDFKKMPYSIRSELSNILGNLGLLKDEMAGESEKREHLRNSACQSALNILQNLESYENKIG